MKKIIIRVAALFAAISLFSAAAFAEEYMSANDLAPADLVDIQKVDDNFSITASAEKGVSIQKCDPAAAADGEVFNQRIKLGGAGSSAFRSIIFKTPANATVTVYFKSSSKTDARVLRAVALNADGSDGAEIAAMTAIPDDGKTAGCEKFTASAAGTYYLTSKSSTIYVYAVSIR